MAGEYQHGTLVLGGLGIYMVLLLAIGWYASKRVGSETDYLVAGRRLGLFLSTGALVATWYGAGTTMGSAGNAYFFGNQGVLFDPYGAALCLLIGGLFFARLLRRGGYLTLVDLFISRYGKQMGLCAAIALVLAEMGWVGALLVGFGTIIQFFTGFPLGWGIGIATVVMVVYTYLGGMWAVTLTDAVQMMIIVAGMAVMLWIAVPLAGGWGAIFNNDPTGNLLKINQWSFIPTPESAASPEYGNGGFLYYTGHAGWFYWLGALMALGLGSIPAQDFTQRLVAARDERTSVRACTLGGALYLVMGLAPVILGMIAFKLYPHLGLKDVQNKLLLIMAAEHLPPLLTTLFVSALVAALMSSASAAILASSSIIGYNGLKTLKPDASDKSVLAATRLSLPIVTAVSLMLALRFEAIYQLMVVSWSVLLVGLFSSYAAAFFWKRANGMGALAAFAGGVVTWIVAYFQYLPRTIAANTGVAPGVSGVYFDWAMWDALYIASVWGVLASVVCLVTVSLLTRRIDAPRPLLDADGRPLETRGWFGWQRASCHEGRTEGGGS